MSRLVWSWTWSCASTPSDYMKLHASGLKTHNTAITGHSSQLKMNGPLWSMSWKCWGHSDIGPCGCWRCIPSHGIALSVYNDMFDLMEGMTRAWAKKITPWKENLFFAVKLARQKLSKYQAEVTPSTGMHLISAHILNSFRKLRSFWKWGKGMDINPEDETSCTTQCQDAFVKYVENKYCAKHRHVPINKHKSLQRSNLIPSRMVSGSCQWSFDPYDLSSDDKEYLTPNNVAETTPGRSDRAARLLTAGRLYLILPPEAPKHWGQINPNLNDYHSDPMEISSKFWLLDITDWWRQQEEMLSTYTDLSNVARKIISIIPHGVGVEASWSLGWDVIGWR